MANIDEKIIVNDHSPVVGTFAIEAHSEMIPDEESVTGTCQNIIVNGKFSCEQYFPTLHTLETRRYKVTGIEVHTEGFLSDTNMIDYIFSAKGILVKIGDPNAG